MLAERGDLREAFKEVVREMFAQSLDPSGPQHGGARGGGKTDIIKPDAYKEIPKRVAIQLYLEQVGREVTFLDLIEAMRTGGMDLPARDDQAFRVLGIVVKQNAGPDGKRDWPARFYRVWKNRDGVGDIDDKVGLLSWKQQEVKAG